MHRSILSLLSAAGLALAGGGAALAQEHSPEHPAGREGGHESGAHGGGDYPTAVIDRPLELPKGMFELQANLLANLASPRDNLAGDTVYGPFKPAYVGFGAAYGVDGHLQVAVSSQGLCLSGTSGSCEHVFDQFAVEAAYGVLHQKGFELSLQAGLDFDHVGGNSEFETTPLEISGGLGVDLRIVSGRFAIRAGPKLTFGLKERSFLNREYLQVPLIFQLQVDPHLALSLGVALNLGLTPPDPYGFGDLLGIPVQVGALYALHNHFDVAAVFVFANLLGKESIKYGRSGLDERLVQLAFAYRL
jgi:hypothetical protein